MPQDSHYGSLNRVYEYIDLNLSEDLSLTALSRISGYSEYHFHRIFHAMTGRTAHEYVLERRMAEAARRLMYDPASITQIALDCGFGSPSSFVRSFRQHYGLSPSDFRAHRQRKCPIDPTPVDRMTYPDRPELNAMFEMVQLPNLRVVGIATGGLSETFESRRIEDAFGRLFRWLAAHGLAHPDMTVMGITSDSPEVTSLPECRYFACAIADARLQPDGEIAARSFLTAGTCIRFSMRRSRPDFAEAFFGMTDYLYGHYLPLIHKYPDNRPFVEMYRRRGDGVEIQFHVPVR